MTETITLVNEALLNAFEVGDQITLNGNKKYIVVYKGMLVLGIKPATWYRRFYWWFLNKWNKYL